MNMKLKMLILFIGVAVYRVTIKRKRINYHLLRNESKRIPHRINNGTIELTYRRSTIKVRIILTTTQITATATTLMQTI